MTTTPDDDGNLATMLREHVREQEPPFLLSAETSMALGRRTLLRRRARRGFAGVLVAAAAVAAVPLLPWGGAPGGDDRTGIDPATAYALEHYDATAMPALIDEHARDAFGDALSGLGPARFRAGDEQGAALPPQHYDKASGMSVAYGAKGEPHQVVVSLMHSRSEAEGDKQRICDDELASGYAFRCTVTTSPDGDPVTTMVTAMRPGDFGDDSWSALTKDELRTGDIVEGDPVQRPIEPGEVYFQRSVESVHSESFLTSTSEIVRAPDLATADELWTLPVGAMRRLVTDPALVIPKPPMGDNGCAWLLHPEGISCG